MNIHLKLHRKHLVSMFILLFMATGCLQKQPPLTDTTPAKHIPSPSPSRQDSPSPAFLQASPSPTATVFPTILFMTQTANADTTNKWHYLFPSEIDQETNEVIRLALQNRLFHRPLRWGKLFFSYVLVKPPEKIPTGKTCVYLFVEHRIFYVDQGKLIERGGGDIPAAVIMEKQTNGWWVDVKTPISGNWGPSIHEIFPDNIFPLLFHSPPIPYKAIKQNIVRQAEDFFGLPFNTAKNNYLNRKTATPNPIKILTLTPTPTVDITSLSLNISTHVITQKNTITFDVDLFPKVVRPFYKGLLSSGWKIRIFPWPTYSQNRKEPSLILDNLKESLTIYEFSAQVDLKVLENKLGDYRGFTFQILDKNNQVQYQDEFYINQGIKNQYQNSSLSFPEKYPEFARQGIFAGFPNLLSSHVTPIFLTETARDDPSSVTTIVEPKGGFFYLFYDFGFASAAKLTSTKDIEEISKKLVIEVFPYNQNDPIKKASGTKLTGKISGVSGLLHVRFPHQWLDRHRDKEQIYRLLIANENGTVYKEALFRFVPYTP